MRVPAGVLGVAFAAALLPCAAANADPVADWPYPDFVLPGYSTGDVTQAGPFIHGTMTYNTFSGNDAYSAQYNAFQVWLLVYDIHQKVVTANADGFPPVGTTIDQFYLLNNPDFLSHTYIYDPDAGFADQFTFLSIQNTFVYDSAGIQDVLSGFGQSITLIDLPAL